MPFFKKNNVRKFNPFPYTLRPKIVNVMRGNQPTKTFRRLLKKTVLAGGIVTLPDYLRTRFLVNPRTGYLIKNTLQSRTRLGSFSTIDRNINRLKEHGETFDLDLANVDVFKTLKYIVKRMGGQKIVIRAGAEYYTLSQKYLPTLRKRLTGGMIEVTETMGSDQSLVHQIRIVQTITLMPVGSDQQHNGDYFNHYHNFDKLDLCRYGIYRNADEAKFHDSFDENCFIKTMRMFFENNTTLCQDRKDIILQDIKLAVVNSCIPRIALKKIAKKYHLRFAIRELCTWKTGKTTDKYIYYGNNRQLEVNIGLINNHYFIIEKTDASLFSIKNYEKFKDKENWNKVSEKSGKTRNGSEALSYDVIKWMWMNRREENFRPIPFDELKNHYSKSADDEITLAYDEDVCVRPNEFKEPIENDREIIFFDIETLEKPGASIYNLDTGKWVFYSTDKKEIKRLENIRIVDSNSPGKGRKLYISVYRKHEPYLCCWLGNKKGSKVKGAVGFNCCRDFLESLDCKKKYTIIAHNAGYDYFVGLFRHIHVISQISKGSSLTTANVQFYKSRYGYRGKDKGQKVDIQIKDSCKLIPMKLAEFGETFGMEQGKDVMPYGLFKYANLINSKGHFSAKEHPMDYCLSFFDNEKDKEQFKANCKKWKCVYSGKVNVVEYSRRYCEIDCKVLKEGYNIFRDWILELTALDTNDNLTIASLAHKYLKKMGCYEGVNELSGIPRAFIQKCIVGGKVMTTKYTKNENEKEGYVYDLNTKSKHEIKMADYDAVSCYPSSMVRMKGFLKGTPKVLSTSHIHSINKMKTNTEKTAELNSMSDGYFVKIQIKEVGIERPMPVLSYIDEEEGVRVWTNEMVGRIMSVDKTSLEDAIKFQEIKFDIIKGYYFNEGRNNKINEVMQYLFDARKEKKAEGNLIESVYKLIMNSAYGKSMLKPIETNEAVIYSKNLMSHLEKHYNSIKSSTRIFGSNKIIVKKIKPINTHFNTVHVGCEVLSMAKRIMNEVMMCADDNNLPIFYTDTDSMHLAYDNVAKLEEAFAKKYTDRPPITGKNLGQFHIDFDIYDENGKKIKLAKVWAIKSIFLGKKSYIDLLKGVDELFLRTSGKEGKEYTGYHIRMKGIPPTTLHWTSKKTKYGGDLMKMYKDLYDGVDEAKCIGNEVPFDLLEGGQRENFEFTANYAMVFSEHFTRTLKF